MNKNNSILKYFTRGTENSKSTEHKKNHDEDNSDEPAMKKPKNDVTSICVSLDTTENSTSNTRDCPAVWSPEQWEEKIKIYPWLLCTKQKLGCRVCRYVKHLNFCVGKGIEISKEWAQCEIDFGKSEKKSTQLTMLRNKIKKHSDSIAHKEATKIQSQREKSVLENTFRNVEVHVEDSTRRVFRTAYYLAKNNRPFVDHASLIELQQVNGLDLGYILHSRFTAVNIIQHLASEMRKKIIRNIIACDAKISILIDESTTTNTKTTLVIFIKTVVNNSDPIYIFFDLIELRSQTADFIANTLIATLHNHGVKEDYLQKNWINFVSDGASVMMGKNSGVATKLKERYPQLFSWHCLNHKLELAVNDVMKEVSSIHHFKSFIDSLYALYNRSPKNKTELEQACNELHQQFLKIGRVLDTRWVSSSLRATEATWKSLPALYKHFEQASVDPSRDGKTKSKFQGLLKKISSIEFIEDLALLCDVLQELSLLSKELQNQHTTLWRADSLIKRTIRILNSFKDSSGEFLKQVENISDNMSFNGMPLEHNQRHVKINKDTFLSSLVLNLKNRLCDENTPLLSDLKVFDKSLWPTQPDIRFGESEIRRISQRFNLNSKNAVMGMRDYVEHNVVSEYFKDIHKCANTLSCSTAECERGFILMNIICTDIRNSLTIENISNLMFLNLNGPPLTSWKPEDYVKSWLSSHRSAEDKRSKKVARPAISSDRVPMWEIL